MSSSSTPVYFQTAISPAPTQPSTLSPSPSISQDNPHPAPKPDRKPLLRLELRDLSQPGAQAFLHLLHASSALEDAVSTVLRLLYTNLPTHCIPPTRSITLVLRSMSGVAYTTGLDIDDDHKEIHLSTDYINRVPESRQKEEMTGVIVHEMVHCWQWNALDTAPGGLIEGIADWVRLKAGLVPPHWRRHADGRWDSGYERTGYFLEWLEGRFGVDVVRRINEGLRECKYEENEFWEGCCGEKISVLWEEYGRELQRENEGGGKGKKQEEKDDEKIRAPAPDGNDTSEDSSDGPRHGGKQTGGAEAGAEVDQEPEASSADWSQDLEDPRSARVKARRGGKMHVPTRPGQG
ncbi:BSP-domain-containing protein, partial [Zopfia rhizophila CBS 207.26]